MTAELPGGQGGPVVGPFPDTAEFEDGTLTAIGAVTIDRLVSEFGTPLYVLDRATLTARMRAYREAFGDNVTIAYAAKSLCVTAVLQLAERAGLHCDVASGGEIATALAAGFSGERLIVHGNNKSLAELEAAVDEGVGRIVVDSFTEIDALAGIAEQRGTVTDVLIRVTPGVEAHTHVFVRTGQDDSKFGFTLSAGLAHQAVERVLASPSLRLRGLHCHIGSQIYTAEAFVAAVEVMGDFLADLRREQGWVPEELNLGGGLGVHYSGSVEPPSLESYAQALQGALADARARHGLPPLQLGIEPGRSISAPAGCTLYEVGVVKSVPGGRTYVSVDGGISDNPRHVLYGALYTFSPAGAKPVGGAARPVTVVGKHCETGDVLGDGVELPAELAPGDLLAVASTGAYNHSMASNYNRLGRPAMVLVGDGQARLIVRRESIDDLLRFDIPLDE